MTYAAVKCFAIHPTGQQRVWARRYTSSSVCPITNSYHNAQTLIGDVPEIANQSVAEIDPADERWPTHCDCGHSFETTDAKQTFSLSLYKAEHLPHTFTLREDCPAGAVWRRTWCEPETFDHATEPPPRYCGFDGRSYAVRLANGRDWSPDAPASNCNIPDDKLHRCWIRHGSPEDGTLHVDKQGRTCAAGAGSIVSGDYHGFLHNGWLTAG